MSLLRDQLQQIADLVAAAQASLPPEVITLQPGDDVQAAINAAPTGSVIEFVYGRYVVGTLTFPRPVVLRSDGATLVSGGPQPTIDGTNARWVTLLDMAFESRADGLGDVIIWQDAENIIMDGITILGGDKGQKRAIRGNGKNITLTNSHIANIWAYQQDSQAFCAWDGPGPYTITNNYLEAAGEVIMFGGADSQSVDRIPADILISGNTITKRPEWKLTKGTYSVKNLLELKSAKRVAITGNTFSNCWTDAQTGYAVLFKSVNQNGKAPWSETTDVLFEGNTITDVENGFNIQGETFEANSNGTTQHGGRTTRIVIRGNDVQTSGAAVQITGAPGVITLDRTTFRNGDTFIKLAGNPMEFLTVSNVLANHNAYGVKGDGTAIGTASLTKFAASYLFTQNVLQGGAGKGTYPTGNWFDLASVPAGVQVGK